MADEFLRPPALLPPSSMRQRATSEAADRGCGEIAKVKGGHIVRSMGRKDRHSKVCTAKGPRDRRVRLSAHTAIEFYDVQDRLGFDRPSKAVDWLIQKAKTSIDKLAELPPWNPVDANRQAAANAKSRRASVKTQISPSSPPQQQQLQFGVGFDGEAEHPSNNENESSFILPSMDSDSIADTLKSFFPVVGSSTEAPLNYQLMHNYHQHPRDLLSRTDSQNQDLRLSLQSFPDGPSSLQRLVAWNNGSGANDTENGGGLLFATTPSTTLFQPVLGQSQQLYSQRGPLQSSYSPMIRAWFDPHHHHQSISTYELNHFPPPVHLGEFSSGFSIPAWFEGQVEEHLDGLTHKPSSASSLAIDNRN